MIIIAMKWLRINNNDYYLHIFRVYMFTSRLYATLPLYGHDSAYKIIHDIPFKIIMTFSLNTTGIINGLLHINYAGMILTPVMDG